MPWANFFIQSCCVDHPQRWTESIAVGRETFVCEMAALTRNRREQDTAPPLSAAGPFGSPSGLPPSGSAPGTRIGLAEVGESW